MKAFSLISPEGRYILEGLLFLASMAQLALCLYQHICNTGAGRRAADGALFSALLLILAQTAVRAGDGAGKTPLPWLLFPLAAALIFVHAALGMRRAYRESREKLSPASIKEALDNLNSGILFSDRTGRTVLINRTMGALAAGLTGAYPQTLGELHLPGHRKGRGDQYRGSGCGRQDGHHRGGDRRRAEGGRKGEP